MSRPDDRLARRSESTDPRAIRTRTALVEATMKLLYEHHVEHLSVSQIVKEAGVSRQVFYQHFSDRDALVLEAGQRIMDGPYHDFARDFSVPGDHIEEIETLMRALAPRKDAVLHLLDSPVHGVLENYIYDIIVPPMSEEIRRFLDRTGQTYTDEELADITRFVAAGNHMLVEESVRHGLDAASIARRADKVHRALGLILQ